MLKTKLSDITDHELVVLAKQKDYDSFEELMHRYEKSVYNLALRITKNSENAEEVLQDSFLSVYKHLADFREESSFKTWVYRVATNYALMKLRGRKNKMEIFLDEPFQIGDDKIPRNVVDWSENPQSIYENEELRDNIKQAVDELPEIYRTVFYLRDVEGFTNNEVAHILSLSVSAVKSRILRARLFLRDKLSKYVLGGE